ncbi:MAG: alpha/beta hydrolase [Thermodesulfobacteriota bacterium]
MKKRMVSGLVFAASLFLLQGCFTSAFYYPDQVQVETPANYHLPFEEVFFSSGDGTRLCGWFVPAIGPAEGTVIHFHGNHGNQSYSFKQVHWLPARSFNVFTFDYRGYGRSEGKPSKRGIYEDSVAALEYILTRPGIDHDNVFVFGQSLGGVNAIVAVGKSDLPQIRAVAVEGAFDSYRAEARDRMEESTREKIGNVPCLSLQIWPVSFFTVTDSYSAKEYIHRVSPIPVLLIHCLQDSVVYYQHSERLYEAAKDPKELWLIDGCDHVKVFGEAQTDAGYRQKLVQFFMDHRKGGSYPAN